MKRIMSVFCAVAVIASSAVFCGCEKKSDTEKALEGLKKDAKQVEKDVSKAADAAAKDINKAIEDAKK